MIRRPWCLVLVGFLLLVGLARASLADEHPSAPALLLANVFQNQTDVSLYWVSEKLDGARAFWDGKSLWFRSGQAVHAPAWFTAGFPARPLDGELWLGRGGFDRLSGIVRKQQAVDEEWRQVRYMVFELPEAPGTFSERIEAMGALVRTSAVPWLQAVEQYPRGRSGGTDAAHERSGAGWRRGLDAAPGGCALRDRARRCPAESEALAGRGSQQLSAMCRDRAGTGACWGRCGWKRRMAGASGSAPVSRMKPAARRRPSAPLITYRYRELNRNGLPRFASYLRMREAF
jgi:DNA ligase-1